MYKRLFSLALVLTLAAPTMAGASSPLPGQGQSLHGFQVTDRGTLDVLGAETVTLEHLKSGATVYYIASRDTNRTFDITFRTPASDDRGMSHILEHSSLSGSGKYPSPNLFFAAANQTYHTFLNAMTSETTTTYPISSMDEDQLFKLMDLYLDGVFHPSLYEDRRIFQREAWRYDLQSADAPITITGTVYNEMKGSVDIRRAAGYHAVRTLFPGSIMGSNSGGSPDSIPDLTWEALVDYHKTYYHPANALIFLHGQLDLSRFLEMLDRDYLSDYDRIEVAVDSGAIPPLTTPQTQSFAYPVEADSPTERGAYLSYGMVANGATRAETAALPVLADILAHHSSPVAQAVRETLPNASLSVYADIDFAQPYLMFQAEGVSEDDLSTFQSAVDRGLGVLVLEGLDPQLAQGVIAQTQLSFRTITEADHQGPSLASILSGRWAIEGRLDFLNFYGSALETMETRADKGYFEAMVQKYLIANPHSASTATVPVPGLKEQRDAALAQQLAEKKAAMTAPEVDALVKATADFRIWSAQEPPQELIDSLKALSVEELRPQLRDYQVTDSTAGGVRRMTGLANTDQLGITALALDLSGVPTKDLLWANLYASLLGKLGTRQYRADQVATLSARYLGNFSVSTTALPHGKTHSPALFVQWMSSEEQYQTTLNLAGEILLHTDFSDVALLKPLVSQLKTNEKNSLNSNPAGLQTARATALMNPGRYATRAYMTGLDYLAFLDDVDRRLKEDPAQVTAMLTTLQATLTNRQNAVSLYAGDETGIQTAQKALSTFWRKLPQREITPAHRADLPRPAAREGIVVEAAVQYNQLAASLEALGLTDSGKLPVLGGLISDRYLTPQMRHVIGAYGATARFNQDGLLLSTYRDPSVAEAYQVMEGAAEAVSKLALSQADIDGYIMSTFSAAARPRGELTGALNAMLYRLSDKTTAQRLQELAEMKTVTPADVHALGGALTRLNEVGFRSTVGGATALRQNRALFDTVLYPNGQADPLSRSAAIAHLYGGRANALAWAKADGVLRGDGSGALQADAPLTHEQLAVLLYRLGGGTSRGESGDIADWGQISVWAQDAVLWAVSTGALAVDDGGVFHPQAWVTAQDLPQAAS